MNVELRGQCMRRGSPRCSKPVPMSKRKTVKWRKRPPSIDNAYPAASRALSVHCTHVPMAEIVGKFPLQGQRGEGWRHFCNSIWVPPTIDSTCRSNLVSIAASRLIRTTVVCPLPAKFPTICYRNVQRGPHKGEKCMRHFTHRRHQGQTSSRTELREDLATWLPSPPTAQQRRRKGRCSSRALLSVLDKLQSSDVQRADTGTRLHQGPRFSNLDSSFTRKALDNVVNCMKASVMGRADWQSGLYLDTCVPVCLVQEAEQRKMTYVTHPRSCALGQSMVFQMVLQSNERYNNATNTEYMARHLFLVLRFARLCK